MKPHLILSFLLLLCLSFSCQGPAARQELDADASIEEQLAYVQEVQNFDSESERLAALFDAYYEFMMSSSPMGASMFGNTDYNHLWDDFSPEAYQQWLAKSELFVATKDWFDPTQLSETDRLNYSIYNGVVARDHRLKSDFPEQYLIIDQTFGIHQMIAQILQTMPTKDQKDMENIISRMSKVPELLEGVQATLKEGIEKGIVVPKNTVIEIPTQIQSLIEENPEQSAYYQVIAGIDEEILLENQKSLHETARSIVTTQINPALQQFSDFMQEEYIPQTRNSFGLSALPNGEAWYKERISFNTTTELTAVEVHEIGKKEVARIKEKMLQILKELDYQGDLQSFNEFVKTDPQFYYEEADDLLMGYRDICKRIDAMLPSIFGKLPRMTYGVNPIPDFIAKSSPAAYYMPGSLDAGKPGYFMANTYDLKSRPKWTMDVLALHEAVPGHHFQIAIAQELDDVPKFRTALFFTAFIEGWGLYAESLGEELGVYQDPYSRYGQLTAEIWRAIRLVVDTGIHHLGWTREEAMNYFRDNAGLSEMDIKVEVDRYIAWPGQALGYKIGELKIQELKRKAQEALGDDFDPRSFHDMILENGSIPLDVLEDNVNLWIKEKGI